MKHARQKSGLPPGSLVYTGNEVPKDAVVSIIRYNKEQFYEKKVESLEEIGLDDDGVIWINIYGLSDIELIAAVGKKFGIHSLVLEDILNVQQRPKTSDFEDYIFICLKMFNPEDTTNIADDGNFEHVSIIIGQNYLITFQEKPGDVFGVIRERIKKSAGKIRINAADYLGYALIDVIVDNYFIFVEDMGDKIELLEDTILLAASPESLQKIQELKRRIMDMRRAAWPLREAISRLERIENQVIRKNTRIYLRDLYEHIIQVIENVENYRDNLTGMLDIYLSNVSFRMNEVMKVLTIIATIFMPLTFIAGVYGMNFKHMPELNLTWGYPAAGGLMLLVAVVMLWFFRRKKWI